MAEENPAEIKAQEETKQDILEDIPVEKEAADSYDELAKGAGLGEEEPNKRSRGRPKGAKNKPKPPPPPPAESEESDTMGEEPPPPKRRKPVETRVLAEPSTPVRVKRKPYRPLMELVAEATREHGARAKENRRNFYESYLPI